MFNFFRRGRGRRGMDDQRPGRGMGGGTKPGAGPSGNCLCPKCGYKMTHQIGQRCMDLTCPKCGTRMVRE